MNDVIFASLLVLGPLQAAALQGRTEVSFPAADEVAVVADLYLRHEDPGTPFLVLFHKSGSSRGEYRDIAPRLCRMGFNCLAVDLRSGSNANRVANLTSRSALYKSRPASFVDALQDVVAALEYVRTNHARGEILALGSSYSAGLVLHAAAARPELIDGVLAFGPTECFEPFGKPAAWLEESARDIRCPVFIASARGDAEDWAKILAAVPTDAKVGFIPERGGRSNALALARGYEAKAPYWKALQAFLDEHFPRTVEEPARPPAEPEEDG